MIKVENIKVYNIAEAVFSARNAMNSWDKSDSDLEHDILGENDLDLARRLYKAGSEHRKYLRQIFVKMDVTCSQTIWSQIDTYKIGVTKNSCSKMHRIHVKEFCADDFSHEGIDEVGRIAKDHFADTLKVLEYLRTTYNRTKEKKYWRAMIDLLPMGYNLKATVTMNYENVMNILNQRSNHKMDEWTDFCGVLLNLPYVKEIRD